MVDGPIAADRVNLAWTKLLPSMATHGNNAIRVIIEPSFSDFLYAVDYAPQPRDCLTPRGGTADELKKVEPLFCRDVLLTYRILSRPDGIEKPSLTQWTFHIPVEDWREFAERLDMRMDAWRGAPCCTTDGTGVAVERVRAGKVRSVENNDGEYTGQSLDNPAYFAQTETQRLLLLYGPSGTVPRSSHWTVRRERDTSWPCSNEQFITADPDGWGVGDDACARSLAGQ